MILHDAFYAFSDINKTSGTKNKKLLLETYCNVHPELLEIILYALNPYLKFGVVDITYDYSDDSIDNGELRWKDLKVVLNSLLSKELTGNAARQAIINLHPSYGGIWIIENILKKRLDCGISTKSVNSVYPGFVPTFDVMLASTKLDKVTFPCIVEPKLDGVRCLAFVYDDHVTYMSRNGIAFENFDCFNPELLNLRNNKHYVFDGEIIGASFDELMVIAKRKNFKNMIVKKLKYVVFDLIPYVHFIDNASDTVLDERKGALSTLFNNVDCNNVEHIESMVCRNEKELADYYSKKLIEKYEGVVIKDPNGFYEYRRSNNWIKLKPTDTLDVPIAALIEGEGKYMGSLGAVAISLNGIISKVGDGFTDAQRKDMWSNRHDMLGRIIEVKYQEITSKGALRFPRFVGFRKDKD